MPKHVLISDVEIVTDGGRRRRWTAAEKLQIVEETLNDCASISVVARRNGVAPNLLYRWRRLTLRGGSVVVIEDDTVISNRVAREMENPILELERKLGRKTLEAEFLGRHWTSQAKKKTLLAVAADGRFSVKAGAETLTPRPPAATDWG